MKNYKMILSNGKEITGNLLEIGWEYSEMKKGREIAEYLIKEYYEPIDEDELLKEFEEDMKGVSFKLEEIK